MCGIAVAIDWPNAEGAVRQMIGGILHRGDISDPIASPWPDTAMGTRRLRIVDGARAVQPQPSFDGSLLVSFNGEIYNHAALREELMAMGIPFQTESDTEVLANALQVWGAGALQRLNGMYAFVAVDLKSGAFVAARDPFGVKPLYVVQGPSGFLFCSEIRPLLEATEAGDVMLLPPGFLLSRKVCAKFKSAVAEPAGARSQGDVRALDRLVSSAVHTRLPADLPVAILLSGGIDSTLVAHYTRQLRPDAPGYFLGNESAPDFRYAAAYAEKSGIDLRVVPFDPQSGAAFGLLEEVVAVSESFEPTVIRGAICSYLAGQAMHRGGFRVALCGDGADELFAGYVPLELSFADGSAAGEPVRQQCLGEMHRTCLQRVDRCSMRFELEMREPFLDPSVAAYALGLDAPALVRPVNGHPRGKMPLRALYDLYPAELPTLIRDRSKILFNDGAGLRMTAGIWASHFEDAISDAEFRDGQRAYDGFAITSKEELYYLRALAGAMDIARVPHLKGRVHIDFSMEKYGERFLRAVA